MSGSTLPAPGRPRARLTGLRRQVVALLALAVLALTGCSGVSPKKADCDDWATSAFFETAAVDQVAACLKQGSGVDARDEEANTPLHLAVRYHDDPAVATMLLEAGADPKARNGEGDTPLHLAARHNDDPSVVGLLLEAGANQEARNQNGSVPLHAAAAGNENPAVAIALIDAGSDLEVQNPERFTPLHMAARYNANTAMITALMEAGANLDARHFRRGTRCTSRLRTRRTRPSSPRWWRPAQTSTRGTDTRTPRCTQGRGSTGTRTSFRP